MKERADPSRLKLLRESRGFTQDGLAAAVHVKRTTVVGWESGTRNCTGPALFGVANALRTSPQYLLGFTDEPDKNPYQSPELPEETDFRGNPIVPRHHVKRIDTCAPVISSSDVEGQETLTTSPSIPLPPDRPAWLDDLRESVTEVSARTEKAINQQAEDFIGEMKIIGEQMKKRDEDAKSVLEALTDVVKNNNAIMAETKAALAETKAMLSETRNALTDTRQALHRLESRLLEGEAGSEDCGLSQSESGGTSPFGHGGDPLHDDMGPHEAAG